MPTSGKIDNAVARCCDVDALTYVEVSSRKRRDRLRRVRLRHPVLPEAWSQGRASRGFPDFRQRRQRRYQRRWAQAGSVTLWRHIISSFLYWNVTNSVEVHVYLIWLCACRFIRRNWLVLFDSMKPWTCVDQQEIYCSEIIRECILISYYNTALMKRLR